MAGKFNGKIFNEEAFGKYMSVVPNVKLNKLRESKAIVTDARLSEAFVNNTQTGTVYAVLPYYGLIGGDAQNYDGVSDLVPDTTDTYDQGVFTYGRMMGWTEADFSYDVTGGADFMENVRSQVTTYWNERDQETILAILDGVFGMSNTGSGAVKTANAEFVTKHTLDITSATDKVMTATTLNTAIQQACGDHKQKFSMVICHSTVATNLENLNLLAYLKYTDDKGVERDLSMATWNGRLVIIDDSMPTEIIETDAGTQGVYTETIGGTLASGDKISIDGVEITLDGTSSASATAAATAFKTAYDAASGTHYTVTKSSGTLTFTEKDGSYGIGVPDASITSTAGTLTANTTTAGVAPATATKYTTYILGEGAIGFVDVGAKVPYELIRDAKTKGGEDTLISRKRKAVSVAGISYLKAVQATNSPTNIELKNGLNWSLVSNGTGTINHKAIPIARIISLG